MASVTFVCGTPIGGAVDSTLALADQARAHGHEVRVIVAAQSAYDRLPRMTAAMVRAEQLWAPLGRTAWRMHDRASASTRHDPVLRVERATDVVAAARRLHPAGALLVVNSVRRLDLQRLLDLARRSGSATAWYLRETTSLAHAAELGPSVGALVANSRPLAAEAATLAARPCSFVPSVIERQGLTEPERREVHLVVNPIPSHGLDVVRALARVEADRRFVLQESWELAPAQRATLLGSIADLPNVEVRPRTDRSRIFRDARVLLLPHSGAELASSRPRVALEAQLLGIPVVAHDLPGLASVAASQDLLVPDGAPTQAWVDALERLDAGYERYSEAARELADREMPRPDAVWTAFVEACRSQLGDGCWPER